MASDDDYVTIVAGLRSQIDNAITILKLKPDGKVAKVIIEYLNDAIKEIHVLAVDQDDSD